MTQLRIISLPLPAWRWLRELAKVINETSPDGERRCRCGGADECETFLCAGCELLRPYCYGASNDPRCDFCCFYYWPERIVTDETEGWAYESRWEPPEAADERALSALGRRHAAACTVCCTVVDEPSAEELRFTLDELDGMGCIGTDGAHVWAFLPKGEP